MQGPPVVGEFEVVATTNGEFCYDGPMFAGELDRELTCILEDQRRLERLAFLERGFQLREHQMVAVRLQLDRGVRR